jgi:hypothetical protein
MENQLSNLNKTGRSPKIHSTCLTRKICDWHNEHHNMPYVLYRGIIYLTIRTTTLLRLVMHDSTQHSSCSYSVLLWLKVHMLYFNVLQLVLYFYLQFLVKVQEIFSFDLQTHITSNKHAVHYTSKFCKLSSWQDKQQLSDIIISLRTISFTGSLQIFRHLDCSILKNIVTFCIFPESRPGLNPSPKKLHITITNTKLLVPDKIM